ncbi:uncharacterized protein M8220_014466 isoform 1-T1 [Acridotheres tristis]
MTRSQCPCHISTHCNTCEMMNSLILISNGIVRIIIPKTMALISKPVLNSPSVLLSMSMGKIPQEERRGEERRGKMQFPAVRALLFGQVLIDIDGKHEWRDCIDVPGVRLPRGYYFGTSSVTGDLSDNHDIISLKLYQLTVERTPEEEKRDREVFLPVVDNLKLPGMAGAEPQAFLLTRRFLAWPIPAFCWPHPNSQGVRDQPSWQGPPESLQDSGSRWGSLAFPTGFLLEREFPAPPPVWPPEPPTDEPPAGWEELGAAASPRWMSFPGWMSRVLLPPHFGGSQSPFPSMWLPLHVASWLQGHCRAREPGAFLPQGLLATPSPLERSPGPQRGQQRGRVGSGVPWGLRV